MKVIFKPVVDAADFHPNFANAYIVHIGAPESGAPERYCNLAQKAVEAPGQGQCRSLAIKAST